MLPSTKREADFIAKIWNDEYDHRIINGQTIFEHLEEMFAIEDAFTIFSDATDTLASIEPDYEAHFIMLFVEKTM